MHFYGALRISGRFHRRYVTDSFPAQPRSIQGRRRKVYDSKSLSTKGQRAGVGKEGLQTFPGRDWRPLHQPLVAGLPKVARAFLDVLDLLTGQEASPTAKGRCRGRQRNYCNWQRRAREVGGTTRGAVLRRLRRAPARSGGRPGSEGTI